MQKPKSTTARTTDELVTLFAEVMQKLPRGSSVKLNEKFIRTFLARVQSLSVPPTQK